ncbi:spermatogenesis-associated protein 31D1-like isoform X2 [Cricetulus griseus]|uniref:Spermatogenesis-associated protein 31D1-like isoform X2 n=1 Tax=Cricetulus griseus TaxID=10029 RepID=A0A9J7K6F4_CRIGR|nr:spermatogenesis-associated protein 31D1-like isoform X2 [Cricetulus griseus]
MPLNNSGKISGSIAGPKNLEVSLPLGSGKGNSGDPHLLQQPSHSKTSEDQSGIKDKQLFWGPSCLHSESLKHEPEATHTAHFNRMAKTPTGNESLACTQPAPLPWLERDQQVWLLTLAESQTKPDSHSKSEALQPQIQWPLFSPLSQLRTCGVHFHRPSDGAQPLSQSEIHQLEYNLLQKALESVLGLPTVTQRSQESFCPPPPKVFLMRKSLKICDPKSILLGDFPLTREVRRKLEHHLRKRLIQHLWGLPNRVQDSLSLMSPHPEPSEFPEMQSSHGPWISLSKHNGSRHPSSFKLIQSESFHKKILETHPLREKDMPIQRQGPGTDQKDHLQRDSPAATMSREGSDSETDPELQPWILSGKFAKPSWVKKGQKKCETFLQEQLSRKTEEMKGGEIPGTKDRGPHSNNIAQPPPETQPRQLKDLAPLAGEEDPLKNHQHSLSISPSKEKILEEHIKTFGRRMSFGLPKRVEESLESYKTKVEPSHPPSQFHAASHAVSAVNSAQTSRFQQRNTSGDGMRTLNFTPIQEVSLPASWPGSQIRPASEIKVFVDKDLSTAQSGREPIQPWTPGMVDKGSLQQSGSDHRHSPELPMRPDRPTVPHNPRTSDYKSQVSRGVVLHSESRPPIQAAGLPDVPSASEEKTSKPQGPSSGDMVASQVLRVHLPTARVGIEAGQSSWFPANVSGKCQNKGCPPAAKRVSPLGGGDAGLGTSQTRGKRLSVQARAPEETHGHTSSPVQSRRGQPLENQFTSQVKCFLQWVSPGRKHKGQERSLAKGSFSSPPVKGTSLIKGRCEFYENIEALKYVRDPGVILRKPLGHRQGTVIPCPQAPVPPFMGSEETQQEVQLLAQSEPVQRYLSCWQAACSQVQRAEACSPGQGQTVPKRCGTAGKAEMVTSPMQAPQGSRVPPKSCL